MSGDDSDGWALEEQQMEDLIAAQNKAEEEAAEHEQEQDTVPPLVFECSLQNGTEEQPADESPPQLISVTERVVYTRNHKRYTAQYLKDLVVGCKVVILL
jgi:hypothetical protein